MRTSLKLYTRLSKSFQVSSRTNYKKAVVPVNRGFEQPRRLRPPFYKSRPKRRRFRYKPKRWTFSVERRRYKSVYRARRFILLNPQWRKSKRVTYWVQPRRRRHFARRLVHQNLYQQYPGKYLYRQSSCSTSLMLKRARPRYTPTQRYYQTPALRTHSFLTTGAQPTFHGQRYRNYVLRRTVRGSLHSVRKAVQQLAVHRLYSVSRHANVSRVRNQVQRVSHQRLYRAQKGNISWSSNLRWLRLASAATVDGNRVRAPIKYATLSSRAAKALRKRLLRRNKRRVTGFSFGRRTKVKSVRTQRRLWRQNRRGYKGLFGKRRYRVERRDRQLTRRTSRRLSLRRALLTRALATHPSVFTYSRRSGHYTADAVSRLLSVSAASVARSKLSVTRTQRNSYTAGCNLLLSLPQTRRTRRPELQSRSMPRTVSLPLKRTTRTAGTKPLTAVAATRGTHVATRLPTYAPYRTNYREHSTRPRLTAKYTLWAEQKAFTEKRFYASRPQLRLPFTDVTRRRRRHGGLGLFTQNNLRAPRTLTGVRNLLLAPSNVLSAVYRRDTEVLTGQSSDLDQVAQQIDDRPRHWARRRLRWVDLVPAFWVANSAGVRSHRRRLRAVRRKYLAKLRARPVTTQLHKVAAFVARANVLKPAKDLGTLTASALRAIYTQKALPSLHSAHATATRTHASRRTQKLLSATAVRGNAEKQLAGVLHARSTHLMRRAERALSAWSPQYQTRWRRWAAPRQDGVLLRKAWPSARALRERRKLNAALLRRHLPQRRYWDRSFIHLQYYQGSAASAGYTRLRRSHRMHSRFSRWWKPTTHAVPFVHPYSRRLLNAKRYYRQALDFAVRPQKDTLAQYTPATRTRSTMRMERHMISRKIPWRNFNYPTPHRGAPTTIQRWTMRYRGRSTLAASLTRPRAHVVSLMRSPRELREVEQLTPSSAVWAEHQWEHLDVNSRSSFDTARITGIFEAIPTNIWAALKQRAGSLPRYAALQRAILAGYRQWCAQVYGTLGAPTSALQLTRDVQYLLRVMRTLLASTQAFEHAVQSGLLVAQQKQARSSIMLQKVKLKRVTFLKHRALPSLSNTTAGAVVSPLARENSHLYKRWLHGAERFLQHAQLGYVPTSRSRYSPNLAVDFGRYRLRFPASGRRRHSFDSTLHAFAKRTAPARFRRTSTLRFTRPRLQSASDFRAVRLATHAGAALKRQRVLIKKLGHAAALSVAWREVLNHRTILRRNQPDALLGASEKRRFAPLPINFLYKHSRKLSEAARSGLSSNYLRASRAGVLRRALRRRRNERAFIDLRKAVLQRRTPSERALRPWKLRRRARRRASGRLKAWRRQRATSTISWGLSHLSAKGTRRSDLVLTTKNISPAGEMLLLPKGTLRRDLRTLRGFCVHLQRRKRRMRRRARDSYKGQRGRRRRHNPLNPRQAVLLKTHWSEGKELRGFRRFGRRPFRAAAKTFLSVAPKLFAAAHGKRRLLVVSSSRRRAASTRSKFLFNTANIADKRRVAHRRNAVTLLSADALSRASSMRRRRRFIKRARRQHGRATSVFAALSWRKTAALLRLHRTAQRANKRKALLFTRAERYTGRRLAEALTDSSAASPLYFQAPTTKIVKSEGAKAKELEADIASKEARYKLTAQYTESLTRFMPELINYMFSKRVTKKHGKVALNTARHLIRNIYWSLRIYLNVDPFDVRFVLRDRNPAVRVRMSKIMEELSEAQQTEQPQRAALRFRFQPARLLRVRNKLRFRGDWLRSFLPAKHALYLENADEYGLFLLRTNQIRRLRYGVRGLASWVTARPQVTHETRARQLLSLRYSRTTPRFETMLQGTRRTPDAEHAPFVPSRVAVPVGFFARGFSTSSHRELFLVGKRLRQQTRFSLPEDSDQIATPFVSVVNRYRVIPCVEARGRTSYMGTERPSMLHPFLDVRAVRTKSPRSRQYVVRTPASSLPSQLNVLGVYRSTVARLVRRVGERFLTRSSRRLSRITIPTGSHTGKYPAIVSLRKLLQTHAAPQLLTAEQAVQKRHKASLLLTTTSGHRAVYPRSWLSPRAWGTADVSVFSSRPALQNRLASRRSVRHTFRAALVLPTSPILPFFRRRLRSPELRSRRRLPFFAHERQQAVLEWSAPKVRLALDYAAVLHQKLQAVTSTFLRRQRALEARLARLRGKFVASLTAGERLEVAHLPKKISFSRKQVALARRNYRRGYLKALLLLAKHRGRVARPRIVPSFVASPSVPQNAVSVISQKKSSRFFVYGGAVLSTVGLATDFCAEATQLQRQAPFDTYRARLWDKLTLRRMKKERLVRYWIKGTSRWMRDPWIADIVSLDLRSKPGRLAGELRPVEQQIGEYVADVDAQGKDISYARARGVERHAYAPRPQPKLTELKLLSRVRGPAKAFVRQRLEISKSVRRKPIPTMWLANYEYNDFWREFKEEKAKSLEQRREEAKTKRQEALARAAKGLPPKRDRRHALKIPPLPKLPKLIWKEIHRRARRLEWRESDEVFFRRGFRNAFSFYPQERNRAPWLEALMYTRATFSTRLREFRRRQFPREQKKFKWLQRVRKSLFSTRTNRYIRGRRWHQLRMYNQRLHYSLFNLPDRSAARRHFRKLNRRTRPAISSFVEATRGLGDRLDVTLLHLRVAPSIFWARVVAPFGLMRVDGALQTDPAYRIKPGAVIHLEWNRIARFQHFFRSNLKRREAYQRRVQRSTSSYPTNFEYHRGTRTLVYRHAPDESDLRRSTRLQPNLFRWFKLDSV